MKLSQLKPNTSNPRQITEAKLQKLKKSIESFEQMMEARPMIVNTNMEILGGNMRYRALNALGYDEIPDIWVKKMDFTPEQEREFIVKDNVGFGEWDWDALANEWEQSELIDWGFEPYNFGMSTDILDVDDETEYTEATLAPEKPKITDEGYVRYEVILLEQDKQKVVETIAKVRKEYDITLAESFMFIIHKFNEK